jgi:hypothetical protein
MAPQHESMTSKQIWAAAIAIVVLAALLPLGLRVAQVQRHKVLLGNIFATAYEFRSERRQWPADFRFLDGRYPDQSGFVRAHWGEEYQSFEQVLVLDPTNPNAIVFDKIWKMAVDENGFIWEGVPK